MSTATNKPPQADEASGDQSSVAPAPGGNASSKGSGVGKEKTTKQRPKATRQRTTVAKPTKGSKTAQAAQPGGASAVEGGGEKGLTFKQAAERVLRDADGPMKVKEIAERAIPLVKTAGKTPTATLSARLVTDANAGKTFIRVAPGTFDLRELNPTGSARRQKANA